MAKGRRLEEEVPLLAKNLASVGDEVCSKSRGMGLSINQDKFQWMSIGEDNSRLDGRELGPDADSTEQAVLQAPCDDNDMDVMQHI